MTARRAGADAHFEMTTTTMGKKEKETVESNWTTIVDDLDHDDDDDDDDGFVVCKKPDSETRLIGRLNETIGTRSFLFLKILFLLFDSLTHFLILICSFSKWMLPKPHYRTDQPCTRIFIHTLTLSTNTTTTTNEHHLTNPTDDCGRNNESVPSSRPQSRHRRKPKPRSLPHDHLRTQRGHRSLQILVLHAPIPQNEKNHRRNPRLCRIGRERHFQRQELRNLASLFLPFRNSQYVP